jgi:hypothetical protein
VKRALTRIVNWSHELIAEVVTSGDLVVDLTAGKGQDVLALFQMVGPPGQVIAFDIQAKALASTKSLLEGRGASVRFSPVDEQPVSSRAGIALVETSHAQLDCYIAGKPRGIIANLGYLPGGDQDIITRPQSTVPALEQASSLLDIGGRVAVTAYPDHPGGDEEATAVTKFFTNLPEHIFYVLQLKVSNRPKSPFLFVAEKLI